MDVTGTIVRFAVGTPREAMPEDAMAVLRLSLLDWIAVAVAGRDEPVARIVRDMVLAEGGAAEAGVIGADARLPARAAALANGTASHALDYDDTHFASLGHPSVAVVPAVLALAEKTGAGGPDTLAAALIGAETAVRIGAWFRRGHYEHGFHVTGTAGAFGAAAGCARLLGLDAERTAHALGIAASRAGGLKAQFGTMGKPFHAGMAAATGVEAATLAAAGFVARTDALECPQGFAATHAGEGGALPMNRFLFPEVSHKVHACCHGGVHKRRIAHMIDRIGVTHQDDGRGLICYPKRLGHAENGPQARPGLARADARFLDDGTICHRVGEGKTQLDDVHARAGQGVHHGLRCREVRVSAHDIGDESRVRLGESGGEARGHRLHSTGSMDAASRWPLAPPSLSLTMSPTRRYLVLCR